MRHVTRYLVASEDVAGVDFVLYVVQNSIVAVCDDGLGFRLEFFQVINDLAAEEGGAVFEGGFVDDYLGSLGLDALHDALDGRLTEVVGIGLHGEAVDSDNGRLLRGER